MARGKLAFDHLDILSENKDNDGKLLHIFRIVLLVIMGLISVGGIAILAIGIWTHEVDYGSRAVSGLIGIALYQVDSVIMIICGSLTIAVMIIGFVGLLRPQKCLLGFHLSVMSFTAFGLFAAGILGYVFIGELEDSVKGSLKESVVEKYGVEGQKSITNQWDKIQKSFRCCGASGDVNSSTSWFLYQHDSFWVRDDLSNRSLVPKSCCSEDSNMELCTGKVNMTNSTIFSSWAPYGEPEKVDPPLTYNYTIFTDGCYDKLEGYLRQNGILIGTAAIVVGVFMIIEIVCTIFEYRRLKF
ncbi:CD151 antigen-like [Mya arenaria]|uniref:CD151 antigen-like n=1 Tax=Mya arenaria TaxID=6604 RepID=UPI0022E211A3|nr:CD151 antigen-like [Mya arenaria]XP_052774105.1 CD151 antigen-like [Mya arenaria]XP_052777355.1 CD151 antigen-like [Mya arenaria]XP_052777356.1 CD151 antigen-like [Mya arenaria]